MPTYSKPRASRGVWQVCFIVFQAVAATTMAAEYWVDQRHANAADTNAGTQDRPWLTIGKAAETLAAGDTAVVKPGIYSERVAPKQSGSADKPITYRAAGKGVVISGADALTSWKRCTPATCPGNPHYSDIWYVDLGWEPQALFEDGEPRPRAREPNETWWIAEGGGTHTLIDSTHLIQAAGFWEGSTVFFWDVSATTQHRRKVIRYDAAAHTLRFDTPIYGDRVVEAGKDRYFLENHLALLDRAGEWVVTTATTTQGYRVYLWPTRGGNPNDHLVEGARRSRFVFEYGSRRHLRIEGFEVRHGVGHGIGSWSGEPAGIEIVDCRVYHNQGNGLYLRNVDKALIRRNLVSHNGNGVTVGSCNDVVIEKNEIADNRYDGLVVSHNSRRIDILANYIHGHNLWGHPDNIQFHNGVADVTIEGNVILDAGQSIMMEQTTRGTIRGNVIVGAEAYSVICGHRNVTDYEISNNTIAFTGYGTISFTGQQYRVFSNVLYPGGHAAVFSVADAIGFSSDHNVMFKPPGTEGVFVGFARNWPKSFAAYQRISGQDVHSRAADPQFVNAPRSSIQIDNRRLLDCTRSKLIVRGSPAIFEPGDHVEVRFDGVVRQVKSVGADHIVVDPPLTTAPEKAGLVLNWKNNTNYALDLRLKPTSPARGAGRGGSDPGANLDIQAFLRTTRTISGN